jgi:hypothetical protein
VYEEDLAVALAGRAGWRLDGAVARYSPGGGWSATVRCLVPPGKTYSAWHTAVCRDGCARHTRYEGSAAAAVVWAQRMVDAGNATAA